jgi:hypothetical protein
MNEELFLKIEYDLENGMGYCESFRSYGFKKEEFRDLLKCLKEWELEYFGEMREDDVEEFEEEDRKLF